MCYGDKLIVLGGGFQIIIYVFLARRRRGSTRPSPDFFYVVSNVYAIPPKTATIQLDSE